jgi:tartrate/fumarate subfamily iron-sulfur-dependent hydro-lyase beta chain
MPDLKISASHLDRDAYLYVRQSTLRQVVEHGESTQRQYALRDRAIAAGWPTERVRVIDCDLGKSGASAAARDGFQELVSEVALGKAGIVMGLEVSRLARNSADWHRLIELCALANTLILDEDGVYDPASFNDRLLLGLKGTMSEAELHMLKARMRGGQLNKARRGELEMGPPVGLVYRNDGSLGLDPDAQVQKAIRLVFETFERTGSALRTVRFFREQGLLFPRRLRTGADKGDLLWAPPQHARILQVLHNPRYAGAFVLASTHYLDDLPTTGNEHGRGFRDVDTEQKVLALTRSVGIGAQFGGKYFCHDVRVIRLPRHGASCPVGIGVSCSADRQVLGKITADGVFLEQLEANPARFLPEVTEKHLGGEVVQVDLNRPTKDVLAQLSQHPIKTRLSLTGTLIVGRDIAHAKLKERLDKGEGLPDYVKKHPIYYAGPAKTPKGYASGSFGPTTAGRMDSYVDQFQAAGGSMIMLAKGNRSKQVTQACKKHGGFYLGSIGGPAAVLALNCIKKVEVLEYPELGMEAIWKVEVENFPAFIVVDDKGNDFFQEWQAD